jgi:hypothetical protein
VGEFVSTVVVVLFLCAAGERISDGGRRRRWLVLPLVAAVLFAVTLPGGATSVGRWLLAAGCSASVLTLTYWFLLRHNVTAVPCMIAIAVSVRLAAANWEAGYGGAYAATALAMVIALGVALVAGRSLAPAAETPPPGAAPASPPAATGG